MAPPSRPLRPRLSADTSDPSRSSGSDAEVELIDGALRPRPAQRSTKTPIAVAGRRPLRALLLLAPEDSLDLVLQHELRQSGYEPIFERVHSLEALRRTLRGALLPDLLLCTPVPGLALLDALLDLGDLRARGLDLPCLVIAPGPGEEEAADLLRAGAHDFFTRHSLARFGPAVARELRQARLRRERREVVHELRLSKERYRLLLDSVRDHAAVLLDEGGHVQSWSRAAERATGYQREQAIGLHLSVFYEQAERDTGRPQLALRRATEVGGISEEGYRVRRDGSRFWADSALHAILAVPDPAADRESRSGSAVVDRDGPRAHRTGPTVDGYLLVLRDLSERRQLLLDLRAADAREAALRAAREELRAQLGTVRLGVEALRGALTRGTGLRDSNPPHGHGSLSATGDPGDGRAVRAGLAALQRELTRLEELCRPTLADKEGRLQLRRERFDLARLLREVATRAQAQVARSGSRLWLRCDEPVFGRWDRLRLDAVLSNLLSNALRYGEGQPIELRLSAETEAARLSVKDRGIGLLPEEQTRLLHGVNSGVPSGPSVGNGVGLWIVRQVVLAHGGAIEVESERGAGTTISILLPYDASPEGPTGEAAEPREPREPGDRGGDLPTPT